MMAEILKGSADRDGAPKKNRTKGSQPAPMGLAPTPQQRLERALLNALQLDSQASSGRLRKCTVQRLEAIEDIRCAAEALPCALGPEHLCLLAQLPRRLEIAADANDQAGAEMLLLSLNALMITIRNEMGSHRGVPSLWVPQVRAAATQRATRRGCAWSDRPACTEHVGSTWSCDFPLRPLPIPSPLHAGCRDPRTGVRRRSVPATVAWGP
jgi:hypothetical protein